MSRATCRVGSTVYRCAAHSLQLVLGDFLAHKCFSQWQDKVNEIVDRYVDPRNADTLLKNQTDIPEKNRCGLLRILSVRWNTMVDAVKRIVKLREYLFVDDRKNDSFFDTCAFFLLMSEPIAELTDQVQGNSSTFMSFMRGLAALTATLKQCVAEAGDFAAEAEELVEFYNERLDKNFTFDGTRLFNFLDPSQNQRDMPSQDENDLFELTSSYVTQYLSCRDPNGATAASFKERVERELTLFLGRNIVPEADFDTYWKSPQTGRSVLAQFARALGKSAATEAEVERQLKVLKHTLNKRRASLQTSRANAATKLAINYPRLLKIKQERTAVDSGLQF